MFITFIETSREDIYPEAHAAARDAGEAPPKVRFADVGCGFGGLTIRLAETFPDKLVVGMEIRDKVTGTAWGPAAERLEVDGIGVPAFCRNSDERAIVSCINQLPMPLYCTEYVKARIEALRKQQPGKYWNAGCVRTNAMKCLPNYFEKGQLEKMFFLFAVRTIV